MLKFVSCCRKAFRSRLFLPSELPSDPDVGESVRTGESPFGGTAPDRRDRHHYPADPGSAGVQCPAGEPAEAGHFRAGPSGEISPEQQESEPIANGFVLDDDWFCVLLFGCPEGVGRQQHGSGKRILLREAAGSFPGSPARRLLFF